MSNDATPSRANDRAARTVARILVGEPFNDVAGLPAPWRDLAAGLLARAPGQSASDVWEGLIAGRPDADDLRRAVLAALPGAEGDVDETQAEHKPAGPSDGAWLSPVDVPALPKAARLDGALLDDAMGAGQWLGDYVQFATHAAPMSPTNFHEMLGLTILAAAVARRVQLRVSSHAIYTNLYSLLVAPSTRYRKSTAFHLANQMMRQAELRRLVLPNRITPESLVMELSGRKPGDFDQWEKADKDDWQKERSFAAQRAWLMEEAASLLDSFDQKYTAGLLSLVLDLWDCPDERPGSSTIGRGRQTIRSAYLTICGPTTPAALKTHLNNPIHWANGLWARFILVTPCAPPVWRFWPPEVSIPQRLSGALREMALERLPMPKEDGWGGIEPAQPLMAELADGVWERWETYCKAVEFDLLNMAGAVKEKFSANYGRFGTISIKVAMLLATTDWATSHSSRATPIVTLQHWARAQMLAEEWRASLHRLVERPVREGEDDDLETKITRRLGSAKEGLSARDISIAMNMTKDFERDEIDRTLLRMEQDGLVERAERKGKRGPTAKVWKLPAENP